MEVEPPSEVSATSACQACRCSGLIATQPIPLTTPITDLWTDRSIAANATEPAAAKPEPRPKLNTLGYASPLRTMGGGSFGGAALIHEESLRLALP